MMAIRFHPTTDDNGGVRRGGAFTDGLNVGVPPEGDIHGGRPNVPDRQPPDTFSNASPDDSAVPGYANSPERDAAQLRGSRSLLAVALTQTLRRWGARVGLTWVSFLLIVAVFAPFIASTRPPLVKMADGSWKSPLWEGLTGVDIALPLIFFGMIALFVLGRRLRLATAVVVPIALGLIAMSFGLGYLIADPPLLERLSQFRLAQESGDYARAVHAPIRFSPNDRMSDLGNSRALPPFWLPNEDAKRFPTKHWLGTTVNGEDMASRMIHATRVALAIGFIATGIAVLLGIAAGAVMGYAGGIVDLLMMRFIEILQAVPLLIILLIVMSFFGKNIWYMMTAIGLLSWMTYARFVRAEFLRLRTMDFVQAANAAGLPTRSILFRHMLPNGIAPVLVNASFGVATAILYESTLSFLGLGLEAKDPSWGQLLNQARSGGTGFNWWIAIFPGLAIFLTVFAYILIGEAMRDAIDPKLKKTEV